MTHTPRLHRSELAVPGSNVRMLEKAPGLGADVVMLDLEDAVAPDDKPQARLNIIAALREQDWSGCTVSLRINGLDTHYCYRDIVDVVEQAGGSLDTILIPKASCAGDIHLVATLLDQIEDAMGLRAADRHLGADRDRPRDGERRGDRRRLPGADGGADLRRGRLRRVDAEPHGVDRRLGPGLRGAHRPERRRPSASATGATSGTTRWRASRSPAAPTACARSTARSATSTTPRATSPRRGAPRCSGFEGKWAIHPIQIELANEVFSPDDAPGRRDAPDRRARCRTPPRRARARSRSTAA